MMSESPRYRIFYFDLLRIVAIFIVVQLHISASNFRIIDYNSFQWKIQNLYNGISRWGVGVFVMISGALFLRRDIQMNSLYKKYVLRIVLSFLAWSLVFSLAYNMNSGFGPKSFVFNFLKGHFHLWYLHMIVGLYIIVPFLRKIVIDNRVTNYFLVLAIVFAFAIPEIISIIKTISVQYGTQAQTIVNQANFYFLLGYPAYFILGYYLNEYTISIKIERTLYLLGIAGFFVTVLGNAALAQMKKEPVVTFFNNNTVNVLFEGVCVFTFFKQRVSKIRFKDITIKRIELFSKYSFGAYLIHPLFINLFAEAFHLQAATFNPIFSIPFVSLLITITSFAASALLNQIPFVKKYLV